ncbi:putative nuclease HARBI1 [Saccostrea cucullata]|uniref:putative nuclease HARBI1 n=1 Tax=Saccostrea cuccullata TaxID=36930 RepID=UPI002ED65D28
MSSSSRRNHFWDKRWPGCKPSDSNSKKYLFLPRLQSRKSTSSFVVAPFLYRKTSGKDVSCFICSNRMPLLSETKTAMLRASSCGTTNGRFPQVLRCVDGTFIKITMPSENEVDYVNRKGYHSLNVQMVCDPNFRITSLCARWPGSTHDSRVWRSSALCHQFERGIHSGLLLGDSGYPCTHYLMTPYNVPSNRAQENFNSSLCRTRVLIEQIYGVLKKRFQCLHYGLRCSPEQAVDYITACVLLHNKRIEKSDIFISSNCADYDLQECINIAMNVDRIPPSNDGCRKRDEIADLFFS